MSPAPPDQTPPPDEQLPPLDAANTRIDLDHQPGLWTFLTPQAPGRIGVTVRHRGTTLTAVLTPDTLAAWVAALQQGQQNVAAAANGGLVTARGDLEALRRAGLIPPGHG